jgi:hypothetical protein
MYSHARLFFIANEPSSTVLTDTAEDKKDREPKDGNGGVGKERDENAADEVAGRSNRLLLYTCFNDGAGNYVDPSWTWFTCWRCGNLTYI